jgi:hypothetical protein
MSIFDKRVAFKPYEYPDLYNFVDAINHSYWIHTEYSYDSDIQDFKVNLTPSEKNAVKNAMLAISQIEVNVKRFWSNLFLFICFKSNFITNISFHCVLVRFNSFDLGRTRAIGPLYPGLRVS